MLRSPTVGRQSANSPPTVGGKISHKMANDSRPTVGFLSANSWPRVGQQFLGELFFTFSTLASAVKRMYVLVVMNSLYMYFFSGMCICRYLCIMVKFYSISPVQFAVHHERKLCSYIV